MSDRVYISRNESESLAHYGILGQKWGLRRYQNPDGSLTTEGKLRYGTIENLQKVKDAKANAEASKIRYKSLRRQNKDAKKLQKERKKQLEKDTKEAKKQLEQERKEELVREAKRKKASEMTDAELNAAINRLRQEQLYNDMAFPRSKEQKQQAQQMQKQGKDFAKRLWDNALVPATTEVAKKAATSFLEKKVTEKWGEQLGLKKSELDTTRDAANLVKNKLDKLKYETEFELRKSGKWNEKNDNSKVIDRLDAIEEELRDFRR